MKVLRFSIEVRGYGGLPTNGPQLACKTQIECPVCHGEFENEKGVELSPWEAKHLDNLDYIVKGSVGFDPGLYCPSCGVLSRVPGRELNEVVEDARQRVTPDMVQSAVLQLELRTTMTPGTDEYYPREVYLPAEGALELARGWDRN